MVGARDTVVSSEDGPSPHQQPRQIDRKLTSRDPRQAVELVRDDAELFPETAAQSVEQRLAGGPDPAGGGDAVDAVRRGDLFEADAFDEMQPQDRAVAR